VVNPIRERLHEPILISLDVTQKVLAGHSPRSRIDGWLPQSSAAAFFRLQQPAGVRET
jgi:hypothetical protein